MRPVRSERGNFTASVVAYLRNATSRYPADTGLARLVRELRETSELFARHRDTGTASQHVSDRKVIAHSEVGDITLDCDVLIVPGVDLHLVTYTAAAKTTNASKLTLLQVTGGHTTPARSSLADD